MLLPSRPPANLAGEKGLFNSPASFSGTKALGKIKTLIFFLTLDRGEHTIKFISDGSPYLESLEIEKLDNPNIFVSYLNTQAENENYYSWYTFTLVNLPLHAVSLNAQAGVTKGKTDDDDLKVFIDEDLQMNFNNRHQHSYFCGFTFKGREDTFTRTFNLAPKSINPTQEQLNWALGVGSTDAGKVTQYGGFYTQLKKAPQLFKSYFGGLDTPPFTKKVDNKNLTVVNKATYAFYRYTPHIAGADLFYRVYSQFFGKDDLGGEI